MKLMATLNQFSWLPWHLVLPDILWKLLWWFFHSNKADVWIPLWASWSLFPTARTNMQAKPCWLNESLWSHFIVSPKKSMAVVSRMLIDNNPWQPCSFWLSFLNLLLPPIIITSFLRRLAPVWSFSLSFLSLSLSLSLTHTHTHFHSFFPCSMDYT